MGLGEIKSLNRNNEKYARKIKKCGTRKGKHGNRKIERKCWLSKP